MAGRVEGKVAFVTGAARGQGRSHAVRLAEEGADIIAIDICEDVPNMSSTQGTEEDLAETVRLVEALDRRILARKVDVRDYDALVGVLADGVAEFGRLDTVVANAGVGPYPYMTHEVPVSVWQDTIDINLTGVWYTCKAAIPHLLANGSGSVIITASGSAFIGARNIIHYTAAKHGVVGIMRTIANEYGENWIRANCLIPSFVNTKMAVNDLFCTLFRPDLENPTLEDLAEAGRRMNILPVPWVEPIDISNGVLFLASDESRYVTGTNFCIDAGLQAKT